MFPLVQPAKSSSIMAAIWCSRAFVSIWPANVSRIPVNWIMRSSFRGTHQPISPVPPVRTFRHGLPRGWHSQVRQTLNPIKKELPGSRNQCSVKHSLVPGSFFLSLCKHGKLFGCHKVWCGFGLRFYGIWPRNNHNFCFYSSPLPTCIMN
jgi:hypothetical protein